MLSPHDDFCSNSNVEFCSVCNVSAQTISILRILGHGRCFGGRYPNELLCFTLLNQRMDRPVPIFEVNSEEILVFFSGVVERYQLPYACTTIWRGSSNSAFTTEYNAGFLCCEQCKPTRGNFRKQLTNGVARQWQNRSRWDIGILSVDSHLMVSNNFPNFKGSLREQRKPRVRAKRDT